jgi:multimeric flavodoxin WrbA
MLIIGVQGSPNLKGNTAFMIDLALKEAERLGAEVKRIDVEQVLKTMESPFCTDCSKPCKGICAEGTEMAEVLELMRQADGVIVASPVYFGSLSGQMKAFFDKMRCLRGEKALLNTVGAALTVGHTTFGGEERAMAAMQDAMLVYGMTVVGNGHSDFNSGHFGAAMTDPARENEEGQQKIIALTRRVFEVAQATAALRK